MKFSQRRFVPAVGARDIYRWEKLGGRFQCIYLSSLAKPPGFLYRKLNVCMKFMVITLLATLNRAIRRKTKTRF